MTKTSLPVDQTIRSSINGNAAVENPSPVPPSPNDLPDVFDAPGWKARDLDLDPPDLGHVVQRLDEFKASGAFGSTRSTASADAWRAPLAAALLEMVKDRIDRLLSEAMSGEPQADVARAMASAAIRDPGSPHHDRLRSRFMPTISEIMEDAELISRLSDKLKRRGRVVSLTTMSEPRVASHGEAVDRRLDIERAMAMETHPGRKACIELAYEGAGKNEIAESLGVSAETIRLWLRDFRHSPYLAPYAEDFLDRRLC